MSLNSLSKLLVIILLPLLFTAVSCNKPTEPPSANSNKIKEYLWTETKLIQPQGKGVIPTAIWGSDTNDVWAVGWNTSWYGEIFHYDGTEWKNVTPQLFRFTIYNDIWGFSKNDIYVAGYSWLLTGNNELFLSSLIIHYDGSVWKIILEDSTNQGYLHKIHGNSKNNIWAVGGNASVYHFNGASWIRKPFPDSLDCHAVFCMPNNQVYMTYEYNDRQINGLLIEHFGEYVNDMIYTKDTCRITIKNGNMVGYKFGYKAMWGVENNKLISVGPWYWKYTGAGWNLIYSTTYPLNDIKGITWNDIYEVGDHGIIINFNGKEWTYIGKYGSTIVDFKAVMPFEKAIYILGYYQGDTWIIKGEVIN
jgi:hypothetical protein